MLLVLLLLILALLPLALTSELPQLMIVSIYAGLAKLLVLALAMMVITVVVRRHRIAEWRAERKRRKKTHLPAGMSGATS